MKKPEDVQILFRQFRQGLTQFRLRRCGVVSLILMVFASVSLSAHTTQPVVEANHPVSIPPKASVYDGQPIKHINGAKSENNLAGSTSQSATSFDTSRLLMAMGIVLGCILVLRWVVTKIFPSVRASRGSKSVQLLSRTTIAPKQQIVLLQVGRRVMIVGDSSGNLTSLGEITDADEVAILLGESQSNAIPALDQPVGVFGSVFGKAQQEYEDSPESNNRLGQDDPAATTQPIDQAQTEISGLIDRMRTLTRQLRR